MGTGTRLSARIFRYDPTTDAAPRYDTVEMPFEPRLRVLDVLEYAVEDCGLGLGYRYFCGVKRCGLCGVNVNGKPVLACWEAATPSMVIEPLRNMPIIRDLTVDRSAFERATVELEPRLVRQTPYTSFPETLTHTAVHDSFMLMNCIECYVCSSACPAVPRLRNPTMRVTVALSDPGRWCSLRRWRCIRRTSWTAAASWRTQASRTACPAIAAKRYVRSTFPS